MENRLETLRNEIDRLIYEKQPGKIRFFIEIFPLAIQKRKDRIRFE
jgi:hypothetical protein